MDDTQTDLDAVVAMTDEDDEDDPNVTKKVHWGKKICLWLQQLKNIGLQTVLFGKVRGGEQSPEKYKLHFFSKTPFREESATCSCADQLHRLFCLGYILLLL